GLVHRRVRGRRCEDPSDQEQDERRGGERTVRARRLQAAPMSVSIRPLREDDLSAVDRIFRLAFGTFVGLPDPLTFAGDSDWTRTRWLATPEGAFVAERGGEIVGSNF